MLTEAGKGFGKKHKFWGIFVRDATAAIKRRAWVSANDPLMLRYHDRARNFLHREHIDAQQ